MPLYNPNRKKQHKIGKKEHWKSFIDFDGSTLHRLFLSEIIFILDRNIIDSSIEGQKIIKKLKESYANVFEEYNYDDVGGLFGMTLWNVIAQQSDDWFFRLRSKDDPIPLGTIY